jgi:hypothetical protein
MLRIGIGVVRYRPTQVTPVVLNWILDLGYWQDNKVWVDTDVWRDS